MLFMHTTAPQGVLALTGMMVMTSLLVMKSPKTSTERKGQKILLGL
jgi:hypothetical protein